MNSGKSPLSIMALVGKNSLVWEVKLLTQVVVSLNLWSSWRTLGVLPQTTGYAENRTAYSEVGMATHNTWFNTLNRIKLKLFRIIHYDTDSQGSWGYRGIYIADSKFIVDVCIPLQTVRGIFFLFNFSTDCPKIFLKIDVHDWWSNGTQDMTN